MIQPIKNIEPNELLEKVAELKNNGYRLVAISSTTKNGIEISYSFDKGYDFLNLRLNIDNNQEIESISKYYSYAFLYENEIKELFGVKINNIIFDFQGNLYITSTKTPFNLECSNSKENEQ